MAEEHGGEGGLLEDAKNDKDKLTKASVAARLKEIGKADPDTADERKVLQDYLALIEQDADTGAKLKAAQDALMAKVAAKYGQLTEDEIKTLVVDDKWLATLAAAVQGELDRVSQTLTGRIRQLAERYATPLPKLTERSRDARRPRGRASQEDGGGMDVRPGYKQTDVGIIPEAWNVKRLGEIGNLTKGKGLLKEDLKAFGSTPAIPYTALYTDFAEVVNYSSIKWFIDDRTQSLVASEPCVLIASSSNMAANTGKASALMGTTPVAIGREVIVFKTESNASYISHLLSTPLYRRKTLSLARGTTIKHLNPATFLNYEVAVPPLPEQHAIAEALSDVDALLGALDRLIAKKRDLKQAAMQQLLTGQTRLPGFHGEWEVKRLGDVVEKLVGGGTPSRSDPAYWGDEVPWVTVKDFATFDPFQTQESITRIGLMNSASHLIPAGTVITSTRMALGKAVIYEVDVSINQDLKAVFLKPGSSVRFLYYWFEFNAQIIDDLGSGSTVKGISIAELRGLPFPAPSLAEQISISEVLGEMDAELAGLERRRAKSRALKQAMMQELLTGRIRLI